MRNDFGSRYQVKQYVACVLRARETMKLVATGTLRPEDQAAPAMTCGKCGAQMTLAWLHAPTERVTGTTWGKDVAAVCPCCSFPGCRHTAASAASDRRLALDAVNEVRRSFRPIHLQSRREREGDILLHAVAIYLATGKRATRAMREHL